MVRTLSLSVSCLLGACHSMPVRTDPPGPERITTRSGATPRAAAPIAVAPQDSEPTEDPPDREQLCNRVLEELDTEEPLRSCNVLSSAVVAGGRVDILEVEMNSDLAPTMAFVVLQPAGEDPSFESLAEAYDVAGESTAYEISPIEVLGTKVRLRVIETTTTYPNTGEPDGPSGEYDETLERTLVCEVRDGFCDEDGS